MYSDVKFCKSRAAAYIRVSTDDQTEFSPDAQLRAIAKYCAGKDIELFEDYVYRDEGISGRNAESRPGFMRMIADAKLTPKPFECILVHKFDRFARNREDSVVYKSLLRKECGVRVISVTEHMEDDKFSIILESMLEAMAEYYSLNLSDEVKKGMTEKALRGELQTPAPLGYTMNDGLLIPVESESKIVKLIFELLVNKKKDAGEIARYLNDLGYFTKKGNCFQKRSVEYIAANPVYAGMVRWNPSKRELATIQNDGAIIVKGRHKAIIDVRTWEAANKVIATSGRKKRTAPEGRFLSEGHFLSGILKCGVCFGKMYLCGKKNNIFRCGNYLNGKCDYSQGITASRAEDVILKKLRQDSDKSGLSFTADDLRDLDKLAYSVLYDKSNDSVTIKYRRRL